jgi:predicted permease
MAALSRWRRYLRFFGRNIEADVQEEVRFHMEMRIRDYESQGMSRAEAERAAHERFGNSAQIETQLAQHDRSQARRATRREWVNNLVRDARLALRGFRRTPGFFTAAVLILGLGIGASVAMFTVFRTVLVRKLPVHDQDRIVVMWTYRTPGSDLALWPAELYPVLRQTHTLSSFASSAHWGAVESPVYDGDRALALREGMVSANFFEVLGARPILGNFFRAIDDDAAEFKTREGGRKLVLSYHTWRSQFGGDSSVIGRVVTQGAFLWTYKIVGVAPAGLDYPAGVDYWVPARGGSRAGNSVFIVGRLAPGATVTSARDEYLALSNRADPGLLAHGAHAATFTDTVLGNVRPVVDLLTAAAGLLLLITCLNVGNLLILRATSRGREFAVRRALGAAYGDIVRQLVVEAVLLAATGGALGVAVADVLLHIVPSIVPHGLPRLDEIELTHTPIFVAVAITGASVLLFGIIPALFAARTDLATPLRLDSRSGGETHRRRFVRQSLVASQVAVALIMVSGAGLLGRSLARLETQDVGFNSEHLMTLALNPNYSRDTTASQLAIVAERLQTRFAQIRGVVATTPLVVPPMMGAGVWSLRLDKEGQSPDEAKSNPTLSGEVIGPGFFKTFDVPILRGRAFTDEDRATSPLVLVVNESFAKRYWPGENPLGKKLRMADVNEASIRGASGWRTVVGVAKDTHLRVLREATPTVYLPVSQGYWQGYFAIRANRTPATLAPQIRAALKDVAPDVTLYSVRTMDDVLAGPLSEPRLGTLLMTGFGIVALLLAAIGLYGVMASLVRDQTREFGIRIALGASSAHVRSDVLRRASIVTGAGAIVGLVVSIAGSRVLSSLLFEVSPTDPAVLGGACVVLLAIGALAAYVPARRATRIDPVQALRAD